MFSGEQDVEKQFVDCWLDAHENRRTLMLGESSRQMILNQIAKEEKRYRDRISRLNSLLNTEKYFKKNVNK